MDFKYFDLTVNIPSLFLALFSCANLLIQVIPTLSVPNQYLTLSRYPPPELQTWMEPHLPAISTARWHMTCPINDRTVIPGTVKFEPGRPQVLWLDHGRIQQRCFGNTVIYRWERSNESEKNKTHRGPDQYYTADSISLEEAYFDLCSQQFRQVFLTTFQCLDTLRVMRASWNPSTTCFAHCKEFPFSTSKVGSFFNSAPFPKMVENN